jgi:hypothetical protein
MGSFKYIDVVTINVWFTTVPFSPCSVHGICRRYSVCGGGVCVDGQVDMIAHRRSTSKK